jgi:ribonuclease D
VLSSPLIKTLRAQCSSIADELGINSAVLAPRAAMEAIAEKRPQTVSEIMECGPLMRWQAEVLEPVIRHLLK